MAELASLMWTLSKKLQLQISALSCAKDLVGVVSFLPDEAVNSVYQHDLGCIGYDEPLSVTQEGN